MRDWRPERDLVLWVTILFVAVPGSVSAFHSGGVGECDGCHSIHSYQGSGQPLAGPYLLKGSDASSVCLNCHQNAGDVGPTNFHISTPDAEVAQIGVPPKQLSPGGDFAWLKKNYSWIATIGAQTSYSYGDRHGHNIVALDYNYLQDGTNVAAPGGTYPSSALTCISCHDPHGKYRRNYDGSISTAGHPIKKSGSLNTSPDPDSYASVGVYRLLGGIGYYPHEVTSSYAFGTSPPAAVAPAVYNRSESTTLTRVGYGSGMSEWCRNCHPNIHNGTDSLTHPAPGALGTTITDYYNTYVNSGTLSGTAATAYWSMVPFEVGTNNYSTLKYIVTNTPTKGPDPNDGTPAVMCLTCHRAHASGWDSITRWNSKNGSTLYNGYVVYNGYYAQEGQVYQPYGQGRSEAEALQAYYQIPEANYTVNEPSFCYKCHASLP